MVLAKSRDVMILNVEYPLLIDLFRNGRTVLDCPEIEKKLLSNKFGIQSTYVLKRKKLLPKTPLFHT